MYKAATYKGCEGKPGDGIKALNCKNTYGDHPDADNDGKM